MKQFIFICILFLIGCSANVEKWEHGTIKYIFIDEFDAAEKEVIFSAMEEWSMATGTVEFEEATSKYWHPLEIQRTSDNSSWATIGYHTNTRNVMKLSDVSMYTVLHELGHVIGLEHEHNRMDRDDYIKVFFGNIEDEDKDQFMIDYSRLYNNTKLPYDYESIMHYSNKTCSKNGKDTLRSLLNPDEELGGDSLTPLDIQRVNLIY